MHTRVDIKHNDTVKVITGRDKGKQGRVLRVFPDKGKVLVEHVMMVKKNVKPNPQRNIKGGIAEQETPISLSNVMIVCPTCGPSRIGHGRTNRSLPERKIRHGVFTTKPWNFLVIQCWD